jgi:hypothetical protein
MRVAVELRMMVTVALACLAAFAAGTLYLWALHCIQADISTQLQIGAPTAQESKASHADQHEKVGGFVADVFRLTAR